MLDLLVLRVKARRVVQIFPSSRGYGVKSRELWNNNLTDSLIIVTQVMQRLRGDVESFIQYSTQFQISGISLRDSGSERADCK